MYYTMNNIISIVIVIVIVCIFIIYFFIIIRLKRDKFYNKSIYPVLNTVNNYDIVNEVTNNLNNNWMDWPETHLYRDFKINGNWKIIPFFGFNTWCHFNCNQFPQITKFLQNIENLKIALLSKIGPKMKLNAHYGWGDHSNNVLRCHYGIILPTNYYESYIAVEENDKIEIQYHKLHDWIVFDDSKLHYAVNDSDTDRIILIIDLERPSHVKKGTSSSQDTKELLEVINEINKSNEQYLSVQ